jgi:CDP-glucose 4,6-dehydratase
MATDPTLRGEAFNFSNEVQMTVLELVNRILELMGSSLEPEIRNEAVHEIRHQSLSAAKARARLDWTPLCTVEQGLERTIGWYRDFLSAGA